MSSKNIHAYVMGEHGDSSFVPWNYSYIGCKKLLDIIKEKRQSIQKLENIHKEVVNAAYSIIEKKKATYYGIGMALSRLVIAILDNENSILTISILLEGEYNQDDVYIGVPAVINSNGIREIVKLELNEEEKRKLDNSCNIMKDMIKDSIKSIIEE